MSRHRDVRCMNYSDEYDGYDDVYGHSVEDDYCVSPSAEQFLFDRSKQQNIASFITEPDIVEDNEDIDEPLPSSNEEKFNLSELERAKLISCMEIIRNVIGDTVSESKLKETIVESNFNADVALDAILKGSSPKKHVTDTSVNKERLDRHSGVSFDKPTKSMFTIPRFSFNKNHMPKDSPSSISRPNNSFKDAQQSPSNFSSLAELVSSHAESTSPDAKKTGSSATSNAQTFGSLAALTTHHLRKSNSRRNIKPFELLDKQRLHEQFVVPKFSVNKDECDKAESVTEQHFPKLRDNKCSKKLSIPRTGTQVTANASCKSVDSLREDFSNMHILLRNNILASVDVEKKSDRQKLENSLNVVNNIHVASPDNCVVDLTTALKEVELLADNDSNNRNSRISKKFYDMPNLEYIEDSSGAMLNVLPVTLNLRALKDARLPYTKTTVSVFGKTLCKTWKTRKPVLKIIEHRYHHKITPFDFSTPYRSTKQT